MQSLLFLSADSDKAHRVVIAIPELGSPAHVRENALALSLTLTPQELEALNGAHPPPGH